MDDVEVVLHRGAVRAAEAAGEEEEQRHGCGQPAARQDAVPPDISLPPGQHAVESGKALRGGPQPEPPKPKLKLVKLLKLNFICT